MKVSLVSVTTLLAAFAVAQKPVSQDEQRGWYGCTAALLDKFEKGDDGSRSACDLWSCLHLMSTRYSRGGGITTLSSALDPICWGTNVGSNLLPKWDVFKQMPQASRSVLGTGLFRPASSSLALYRALLKASPKVPLPGDLKTAWGIKRHPIANVIRRAFVKNRNDTSARLVYPALQAGYRMLDTLSKATNPDTPEYDSILTFLRKRLDERNHVLQQKETHPPHSKNPRKPSSAPNPNTIPLLVKTTPAPTPQNPKPTPIYTSEVRPRPSSDLPPGKKRKIPVLEMAREYPLLRLGRPQSPTLDRVLTQKNKKRVQRMDMFRDWNDEDNPRVNIADCKEEDQWDKLVDMLGREGQDHDSTQFSKKEPPGMSFTSTLLTHGVYHILNALSADRSDAVARADAMREIIKQEKAMASQEKAQDHEDRRRRWEARMAAEHGASWENIVAEEKRQRDEARAVLMRLPEKERIAVVRQRRLEKRLRLESEEKERLAAID